MFHIISIRGVLTAMNDQIHCHRLLLSHFITTTKILAAVTLGFHLCQFNIGSFEVSHPHCVSNKSKCNVYIILA